METSIFTARREQDKGTFCWDELLTHDPETCANFYSNVFPWRRETMAMGEAGDYHLFKRTNDQDGAGMLQMPPEAQAPSHWLPYVLVDDPGALAARVESLGGQVILAPKSSIRGGTLAIVSDPTGGALALQKWPL